MQKSVQSIHRPHAPHMVGDGLPVRNFFSYSDQLGRGILSPFLMLDYGSPSQFPPTEKVLGVGMHPHRGFETVTLVFQGGLEHRDTAGNHGSIGPGDVQWMTAGSGVLHEELHAKEFRKTGGTLQMLQLWVNLPANKKMTSPRYQTLLNADIPVVMLDDARVKLRIIAGTANDAKGPAKTFTPVNLWDTTLKHSGKATLTVPEGHTTALLCLDGQVTVNGEQRLNTETLAVLDRRGTELKLHAETDAHVIVLSGLPIEGPVVGYGPFVMNTREQIAQAMDDYQRGRFGSLTGGV
ncbi:MAG: pirin family protein [Candidatus Obscuribacterales bacterium]|nr:pirin family protein [Candidatus Obscuribacterales bacterium]